MRSGTKCGVSVARQPKQFGRSVLAHVALAVCGANAHFSWSRARAGVVQKRLFRALGCFETPLTTIADGQACIARLLYVAWAALAESPGMH